jgi:hypothetical protein
MSSPQIKFALFETYMSRIQDSVSTNMFRKTWCLVDNTLTDVTGDGELSCPIYVSSILMLFAEFGLIKKVHANVDSTVADMKSCGWKEISELKVGAVIVWVSQEQVSGPHKHIGFYLGDNKAISHRDITKSPMIHDANYASESGRDIEAILWHDRLATDTINSVD